jgi:hypothetical protein
MHILLVLVLSLALRFNRIVTAAAYDPCPAIGPESDPVVRLAWLKCAVKLGNDECEGRVPIAPNSDQKLPCGGRDITNGALGKLLLSNGNDTEGCMTLLRKVGPGATFNGQSWPAIWYSFGDRFNKTDQAFLIQSMKSVAAMFHTNSTNSSSQAGAGQVGTDGMHTSLSIYCSLAHANSLFFFVQLATTTCTT